tara:strand:+ start:642 stop:836 length:195 start_codon:yes stop_codon:yes gene_type:complete
MSWGSIYCSTWFGSPVQNGWGGIYFGLCDSSAVEGLIEDLCARADNCENETETTVLLTALENCE